VLAQHWGGGFVPATQALLANPDFAPGLHKIAPLGPQGLQIMVPGVVTLVALVLITSFGPWALPQMVQKFYSIRSKADVNRALIIAGVFALFMSFGAYYSGALTHLAPFEIDKAKNILFDGGVIAAAKHGNPNWDVIIPHFITHSGINMVLVLVIVLMVFSASMSSLSSLVLVSSSAIAVDIFGNFINRDANQKKMMGLMRIMCIVFVAASLVIALLRPIYIVNLMIISWGTLAGVFLAPFLYGLFWKRTTKAGVFAGIITGLASALTLFLLWGEPGVPLAGAITMFLPLIVVPIVSLLTPPPPKELVEKAFTDTEPEVVDNEKATI
jgi:Na+/proline symporter